MVCINLNRNFNIIGRTHYPMPMVDTDVACNYELAAMINSMQYSLEWAAHEVLSFLGEDPRSYNDPILDLTANFEGDFFEYRGYEATDDFIKIQCKNLDWSIDDGAFFREIGFCSKIYIGEQSEVLEAWRPHPAISLEFEWSDDKGDIRISGNDGKLIYDAIWPEYLPQDFAALREVLTVATPVPEKINPRSFWHRRLIIDFNNSKIHFNQTEFLEIQHEFCSGIMPLSELVWFVVTPQHRISISEEERTSWLETGIAQNVVETYDPIVDLEVSNEIKKNDVDFIEEYEEELFFEECDEFYSDRDYQNKKIIIVEDFYYYMEAYLLSEEEGWFYDDN